ncbi:hypothetical protein ACTXT7_008353 [Hymenolepis weldensis]
MSGRRWLRMLIGICVDIYVQAHTPGRDLTVSDHQVLVDICCLKQHYNIQEKKKHVFMSDKSGLKTFQKLFSMLSDFAWYFIEFHTHEPVD